MPCTKPKLVGSFNNPRNSIDTIGTFPSDMELKYIIVIIDTFTRYVELFNLRRWTQQTYFGDTRATLRHHLSSSQTLGHGFVKNLQTHQETGIEHHTTIPYSKEENGIVERRSRPPFKEHSSRHGSRKIWNHLLHNGTGA